MVTKTDYLKEWLSVRNLPEPKDVNNGKCEDFALDMLVHFPGGEVVGTDNFVEPFGKNWPGGHVWILYEDRHYDSETIESGVSDWKDLPFFLRRTANHRKE